MIYHGSPDASREEIFATFRALTGRMWRGAYSDDLDKAGCDLRGRLRYVSLCWLTYVSYHRHFENWSDEEGLEIIRNAGEAAPVRKPVLRLITNEAFKERAPAGRYIGLCPASEIEAIFERAVKAIDELAEREKKAADALARRSSRVRVGAPL
jgi:hypothetical protein